MAAATPLLRNGRRCAALLRAPRLDIIPSRAEPLIPAETRKKISIVSASATLSALQQHVGTEQIPKHLGGTRPDKSWLPPYPRAEPVPKA